MMVISDPDVDDPKRGFPLYGHMGILRVATLVPTLIIYAD